MNKNFIIRLSLLAFFGTVIGVIVSFMLWSSDAKISFKTNSVSTKSADFKKVDIGGDYELLSHNGDIITQDSYSDSYKIIYFGFTHCQDICVTALQTITELMDELAGDADKIQPLFIGVDTERDTSDMMKDFVSAFHTKIIGLTGTQEQIDNVAKSYRVYVKDNAEKEGQLDHSSYLYFMSPNNEFLHMFRSESPIENMSKEIRTILKENKKSGQ